MTIETIYRKSMFIKANCIDTISRSFFLFNIEFHFFIIVITERLFYCMIPHPSFFYLLYIA